MDRPYDVVTFDCYGTLIDWNKGLGDALVDAVGRGGSPVRREELLHAYHSFEPLVEAESRGTYRSVLMETARRAAEEQLGCEISPEAASAFAESLPGWLPFPDTNPALELLHAAGYRLGILSNVDDDLLAGTLRYFSVPFELTVTAQQVGSYKPAPAHFEAARRVIGKARWLHVAQSYFHDVVPAGVLGVPVAWINRHHEWQSGAVRPDYVFSDLTELADWLTFS